MGFIGLRTKGSLLISFLGFIIRVWACCLGFRVYGLRFIRFEAAPGFYRGVTWDP